MVSVDAGHERRPWRIPALGGITLGAYRVVWVALFVAALATAAYVTPRATIQQNRESIAAYTVGLSLSDGAWSEGIQVQPFGEEGRRLGFRTSDRLLRINGQAISSNHALPLLLAGPPGSIAVLEVRHLDGTTTSIRVPRDPQRVARAYAGWGITFLSRRWIALVVETLASLVSLAAAALLFLRRPRDPVAQMLAFSLVFYNADVAAILPAAPPVFGMLQETVPIAILITATLLFPDRRFSTGWHWLAFGGLIAFSILSAYGYFHQLPPLSVLLFGAIGPAPSLLAISAQLRRTLSGIARQQTKFVLFGVVALCVFTLIGDGLIALEEVAVANAGAVGWVILGAHVSNALAVIALPAGLLVSLLRFRLYDAETAISRSVAYGALTLALVAIFVGSEKVIEILGEEYLGKDLGALAGGLGAAVAAAMIAPLHHRVTHWAEHRFQGNLVHLRKGLPLLVGDMRETATPAALADAMLARVESGVRARYGAVVIDGRVLDARDIEPMLVEDWLARGTAPTTGLRRLHCERADPLFPMRVPLHADGAGLVGWLLLGPRPDGSFYGRDERETLLEIADPVARALAVAVDREAREAQRLNEVARIHREMESLRQMVRDLQARMCPNTPMGDMLI